MSNGLRNTLTLLVIVSTVLFAQEVKKTATSTTAGGFKLTYQSKLNSNQIKQAGGTTVVDYVAHTNVSQAGKLKLPVREFIIAIPANSKPRISLENAAYTTIANSVPAVNPKMVQVDDYSVTTEVVKLNSDMPVSQEPLTVVKYFWYRDFYCALVRVNLASYNYLNNSIKELKQFTISVDINGQFTPQPVQVRAPFDDILKSAIANAEVAESFRAQAPVYADTTGGWIYYDARYVKFGVYEDRVFRVTKADLQAINAPVSTLQSQNLRMFYKGKEVPIYVATTGTGDLDYFEFYATKNYEPISPRIENTSAQPYNEYLNRYSDTTYYFLTWEQGAGTQRIPVETTALSGTIGDVDYFTEQIHVEKNLVFQEVSNETTSRQDPDNMASKIWLNNWIYTFDGTGVGDALLYPRQLTDIMPGKTAALYCKMIGNGLSDNITFPPHYDIAVGLKSSKFSKDTSFFRIDQQTRYENQVIVAGGTFLSDSLKSGIDTIVIRNYKNTASTNTLAFDWYELEVPRKLKAKNDSLYFTIQGTDQTGFRSVRIDRLSANLTAADYILYRVAPTAKRITGFKKLAADTSLYFSDTVQNGSAYYLLPVSAMKAPVIAKVKRLANLRAARSADYIGITHASLYSSAKKYVGFIKSSYNLDTVLVLTDDIFDEFAYGFPDPIAIKRFLQYTSGRWSVSKMPSAVCLLGTGCFDYKETFKNADTANQKYLVNTNLVTVYGEPVSDTWYTIFNDADYLAPQMLIGRIPAKKAADLDYYYQKHQAHLSQRYTAWNKHAILFSGGKEDTDEIQWCYTINEDSVKNKSLVQQPFALVATHFHKVPTGKKWLSFGTPDQNYVDKVIADGGAIISYIGHSAPNTWDNDINDPNKLRNTENKGGLITDYGCSSGKFAEPNTNCFGSDFLNNGQAMGYIGNTSLGFISYSNSPAGIFYGKICLDTLLQVSKAHYLTKLEMNAAGSGNVIYKVFTYTNTLLGDPVFNLPLPKKPEVQFPINPITLLNPGVTDKDSTTRVCVVYENIGFVTGDSVSVTITARYDNKVNISQSYRRKLPAYRDTLYIDIPVRNKYGQHAVNVVLNADRKLDEFYTDNNSADTVFYVVSLDLRPILKSAHMAEKELKFPVLNATDIAQNGKREMIIQLDTQSTFQTAQSRVFPLDTFYTNVTLSNFANGKYYMRLSLNTQIPSWSKPYIIEKNDMDQQFFLHTQSSFSTQYGNSVDNRTSGVSLAIDTLKYHLWTQHYPGGEILLNGENVLPSSTGDGMSLVVLNPSSLKIDTAIVFNYEADPTALRNMGLYLQTIPDGKIVLMITTGDPTCGTNKFKTDTLTKNAIRRFGSAKVDQIGWFTPWVLIGKVGSAVGTAKEFLRGSDFMGILSLDTTFIVFNKNGYVLTDSVTNVSHWKEAVMTVTTPGNSQVQVIPIIRKDTVTRELAPLTFTGTKASLSALDAQKADSVRFRIQLTASSAGESPAIQNFGLTFDGGMEVGLSPETIKKPASTLILGKTDSIGITVSNAGYQAVDTLNVLTVMSYNYSPSYPVQPNDTLSRKLITNLPAGQRTTFYVPFTIKSGNPSRTIQVKLDPEHRLHEYFTDNNLYSLPVTVYADSTTQADIIFYADSVRIFDGDYISDKAVLRAEIYDPAIRPITDTTFIDTIMVSKGDNDYRIFPGDQKITCTYGTNNPSLSIQYKPGNWEDGHYMYTLRVHNGTKTAQIIKSVAFEVSNSLQMLNVYNYPNPMKDKTNFTFQLSQVPDEMKIKIFTVAGRLIREIVASPAELRAGFNKTLTWDARDKDGDAVANGVYLAKFIVKKDGKTATTVQKLVVMR